MDTKTTSWVSYITFIGWIVAYCAGDKEGAKFHLNQSLVLSIGALCVAIASYVLVFIPVIGALAVWVAELFLFVMWIIGLVYAVKQEETELPLIGKIKILK